MQNETELRQVAIPYKSGKYSYNLIVESDEPDKFSRNPL